MRGGTTVCSENHGGFMSSSATCLEKKIVLQTVLLLGTGNMVLPVLILCHETLG